MRLPLRMKKAGKNVVPTLIMKKSWVSYRIVTFMEPMRSLTSQGHQVNQIPQRDRRQNGPAVSLLWQSVRDRCSWQTIE